MIVNNNFISKDQGQLLFLRLIVYLDKGQGNVIRQYTNSPFHDNSRIFTT